MSLQFATDSPDSPIVHMYLEVLLGGPDAN